jgi:predicted ABC-type transport system involved in lysophospholipase L1 biosynthesis ATPase subunit
MTALVGARSLRKSFAPTEALRGVSVDIEAGETVAVTGPSGSGKSTLLLCLAGILRPEAGEVVYDGRRLDLLDEADRTRLRRREIGDGVESVIEHRRSVASLAVLGASAAELRLHSGGRSDWSPCRWR